MISDAMRQGIVTMRPFLPARNYSESQQFYQLIGFSMWPIGEKLCHMQLGQADGAFAFLLQDFYVKDFAENLMMHVLVDDLDQWWSHIEELKLGEQFHIPAPRAPKQESWGLRISYLWDPSGVLWHFAEEAESET